MYRQNNQRCRNIDEFKADLILIILHFDFAIKRKGFPTIMPNLALPARITLARRITILLSEPAICLAAFSWLPRQRRSWKGTPESRLQKTSVLQRKLFILPWNCVFWNPVDQLSPWIRWSKNGKHLFTSDRPQKESWQLPTVCFDFSSFLNI